MKNARFFVSCFNASPEFAASFKFQKSRGEGEFAVKYMLVAFNKEAESGEFFIEFEEKVWEHKLVESFQSQGAGQVTTITFANNDGGESAANALVRVMTSQKNGDGYTRGTCPPTLHAKALAKIEEAHKQQPASELDEKTAAAIKLSLETQVVKLEGIESGMQSQAVKLEGIEQGVCNVIPDYQQEIKALRHALAYKTRQCDVQEAKTALQTGKVNQRDKENESLRRREEANIKREESLLERIKELESLVQLKEMLQEERAYAKVERAELKHSIAEVQENAKTLADMIAREERAAKRQRV